MLVAQFWSVILTKKLMLLFVRKIVFGGVLDKINNVRAFGIKVNKSLEKKKKKALHPIFYKIA